MAYGSTNLPPNFAGERSLRVLQGEKPRGGTRELPGTRRRRKGKLSLVTGTRLARAGSGWRTSSVFGVGLIFCGVLLGVMTMAAMRLSSSHDTATSKPVASSRALSAEAAVRTLAPVVRNVQLGLTALDRGDVAAARAPLELAVPLAAGAQTRIARGSPSPLLRRGVDAYVRAVTAIRDDVRRGNLFAAGQTSIALERAESDLILSLGGVAHQRSTSSWRGITYARVSG